MLGGLAAFGCGAEASAPLRLELDPGPSHRAAVIAVGDVRTGPLEAWDLAAPPTSALLADLPADAPLPVIALYYEAPPSELGLEPGPLVRAQEGLPLPEADRVQTAALEAGEPPRWQDRADIPPALAALRVARRSPCAVFEPTAVDLPFFEDVRGLEVGPHGAAWVLSDAGGLYRVTPEGQVDLLLEGLPGGALMKAADDLWLAGALGSLARVRIGVRTASVVERFPLAAVGRVRALAASPGGAGPRFALTSDRRLYGGGPSGWRELARVDEDLGEVGGAVALSETEALFGFDEGLLAYRWRDGGLTAEVVPANALRSGLNCFRRVPGLGTVIGTGVGELLLRPPGADAWTKLEGAYATLDVEDIEPYEQGFVYIDESGVMVQYAPEIGYCEPISPPPTKHAEGVHVAARGLDLVAAGAAEDGRRSAQLFWYRRQGP